MWLSSSEVVSLVELLLVKMPLQYLQPILPSLIKVPKYHDSFPIVYSFTDFFVSPSINRSMDNRL